MVKPKKFGHLHLVYHIRVTLSAILNLTLQICKPLETVLSKVFLSCSTKEEVCDKVRSEWRVYQMELIPESCYLQEETSSSSKHQKIFYWEKAFQLYGLPGDEETHHPSFDVDIFINSSENKILSDTASSKFPCITSLFKIVLSLSHGNSAPENGFSINNYMIQLRGTSIGPDTIEALRFVKGSILSYGSILDISITKSLLQAAKLAHSRYQDDLEVKRKLKEDEEKGKLLKQSEDAQKLALQDERNVILASIQQVSNLILATILFKIKACVRYFLSNSYFFTK